VEPAVGSGGVFLRTSNDKPSLMAFSWDPLHCCIPSSSAGIGNSKHRWLSHDGGSTVIAVIKTHRTMRVMNTSTAVHVGTSCLTKLMLL
jgi:hypothetical protein